MALGGTVHTSKRDITAADFFTGMFETALAEDEIIEAISMPKPRPLLMSNSPIRHHVMPWSGSLLLNLLTASALP